MPDSQIAAHNLKIPHGNADTTQSLMNSNIDMLKTGLTLLMARVIVVSPSRAPVAQLDSASDFGSEGWGFESLPVYHFSESFRFPNRLQIPLSI